MYEMNIEGEYRRESALRMLVHVEHDTLFSEMPKEMKTPRLDRCNDRSQKIQASDFVFGLKVGWRTCSCSALPAGTYRRISEK